MIVGIPPTHISTVLLSGLHLWIVRGFRRSGLFHYAGITFESEHIIPSLNHATVQLAILRMQHGSTFAALAISSPSPISRPPCNIPCESWIRPGHSTKVTYKLRKEQYIVAARAGEWL